MALGRDAVLSPERRLPAWKVPGDYGPPFMGMVRDRLQYFYGTGGRSGFFVSRMREHGSTVVRLNMPPGPFVVRDPRVVALLDAASFLVLFDNSLDDKTDFFTGTFMPSTDLTGGYRILSYMRPSEPIHAPLGAHPFKTPPTYGGVLPQLMCKHNECFFRELVKLWSNYCLMVKWTTGFLSYLDRCFVHQRKIPTLGIAAATSFFSPVFAYFNREITAALLTLINQERQGRKIEMDLLMDVMCGICRSEVNALMRNAVLQDTYTYYSMRSSEWILEYSLSDYLAKVQESINKETERLSHYLCMSDGDSRQLCLQVVSAPMMQTYERYARENQIGGQLLLQTYKTVEEELLDRCRGLTLGSGSDNGSFNYRG